MELDTFMLTVEDFLDGRLKAVYFKEELNFFKDEFIDYKENLDENAKKDIHVAGIIESALDSMMRFFSVKDDKKYISDGLAKLKEVHSLMYTGEIETDAGVVEEEPGESIKYPEEKSEMPEGSEFETTAETDTGSVPDISSEVKVKMPPGHYFKKPEEEKKLESIPIDSPLYNLIEEYKTFCDKRDVKAWVKDLLEAEEDLNIILEKTEEVSGEKIEELRDFILQALKIIEDLQIEASETERDAGQENINEIKVLNLSIYNMIQEIFPDLPVSQEEEMLDLSETSESQLNITEGVKTRLPLQSYYEKPKDMEERKVEYISDPVDSPFYSLLASYQEFLADKIEMEEWLQRLRESEEELNYLINKTEEELNEQDELRNLLEEASGVMANLYIEYTGHKGDDPGTAINDYINDIRRLNSGIYKIQQETLSREETLNMKDTILQAYERFNDEDFKTGNYNLIEEQIHGFLKGEVPKDIILNTINDMKDIISNAQEEYDQLPVSEEELTLEVLRGDKLLTEGFLSWLEGIEILGEALDIEDREYLLEGLEYIFNGNKKLVLVQYFSDQVSKMAQHEQGFKSI